MFFSLLPALLFFSDKISVDSFKDESKNSLKENNTLKFALYVEFKNVMYNFKPQCKLSDELLEEEYEYNLLFTISTYPTLIKLKYFPDGIHYWVTVVSKWIFDSSFPIDLPLTKNSLYHSLIIENWTKGINGYKRVFIQIGFYPKGNNKSVIEK